MSFCIAKIIDGEMYIHSDSLMSGKDVVRHNGEKDTILKAVLINHHLCLIYAGNIEVANALIQKIFQRDPMSYRQLIEMIYKNHVENEFVTEYIIASTINRTPRITEVKDNRINDKIQSAWVGSSIAFNSFQGHFDKMKNEYQVLSEAFSCAFSRVLTDREVPKVGGFHIKIQPIINTERYQGNPMLMNYQSELIINSLVDDKFFKEHGYSDSKDSKKLNGGFAYTVIPSMTLEFPGFGIHFGHVNVGMLYVPKLYGIYPETFYNCTGHQFINLALERGIILRGLSMDNETSTLFIHK